PLVVGLALRRQGVAPQTLLLAGVAVSLSCSATILFLQYLADSTQTFRMVRWMMGGLAVVGYREVLWLLPWILGGSVALLALRWDLNLLLTGEELAASRGAPRPLGGGPRQPRRPGPAPPGRRHPDPAAGGRGRLPLVLRDHPLPAVPGRLDPDLSHGPLDDGRPGGGRLPRGALAAALDSRRQRRPARPPLGPQPPPHRRRARRQPRRPSASRRWPPPASPAWPCAARASPPRPCCWRAWPSPSRAPRPSSSCSSWPTRPRPFAW